jgi:MFS transporter, PAT family, beta-lactamase induction signal transducer AmpG
MSTDRATGPLSATLLPAPHPAVYMILYVPFGALGGFITVALTFLATRHGMSITEGSFLGGAQMVSQWLKWIWAPAVDVSLSPKRWYLISTALSAIGVFAMAVVPLGPDTLPLLLVIVGVASLVNSIVGMAIESMLAQTTQPGQEGRVSAWFQAGNLGGSGLGGGLGLFLLQALAAPWMAGAIMGALFLACSLCLIFVPNVVAHKADGGAFGAVRSVFADIKELARARGGLLAALLCFLPIGTGAGQGVLTQASVAAVWGASDTEVALVQGLFAGVITAIGCFAGGWVCDRLQPRTAYASIGLALAGVGALMGLMAPGSPLNPSGVTPVTLYVVGNLTYAFVVGLAYAAFTAVVLQAIGRGSAATKYSLYASLSNFPIWWLGLLLGRTADKYGAAQMLYLEAGLGVVGVLLFASVGKAWKDRSAPPTGLAA